MSLEKQLSTDLVASMKAKDTVKMATIRAIKKSIKDAQVAKSTTDELSDAEVVSVIQKLAKQRNDSIDLYNKGNRQDLADIEREELEVLKTYLPKEADESKINEVLESIIASDTQFSGELTKAHMGKLIASTKEKLTSELGFAVDGKLLADIVKNKLN